MASTCRSGCATAGIGIAAEHSAAKSSRMFGQVESRAATGRRAARASACRSRAGSSRCTAGRSRARSDGAGKGQRVRDPASPGGRGTVGPGGARGERRRGLIGERTRGGRWRREPRRARPIRPCRPRAPPSSSRPRRRPSRSGIRASRYSTGLPALAMTWRTVGSAAALAAAARSLRTISSGVPAGTNSADHCAKRTGWPSCFRLGTSGSALSGRSPQCASARSLPAWMCCRSSTGRSPARRPGRRAAR